MLNFSILLLSVAMGATGQFLFRLGMRSYGQVSASGAFRQLFSIVFTPAVFIGFVLFGMSSVIWLSVISKSELSSAYPMVSLGYILTLILSKLFLNEQIGIFKILGTLFIVCGVAFISRA